jgi:hypothetical protein
MKIEGKLLSSFYYTPDYGKVNSTWALFIVVHKLIKREVHYAVGKVFVEPHTLSKECHHFVMRMTREE